MNNLGTTVLKIAALAGGAFTGFLLMRRIDEAISRRTEQRSHYDKTRYEQGLSAISPKPLTDEPQN